MRSASRAKKPRRIRPGDSSTRSAVAGIAAAALGIPAGRRRALNNFNRSYHLAARASPQGRWLRDYHRTVRREKQKVSLLPGRDEL